MTNIDEKRSLRLRQALRDMGNYGVKLGKPEDSPFYDQPVDYEAEKKRFEPFQEEEQKDMESNEEFAPTERAAFARETHQRVGKTMGRKRLAEFQEKYLQPLRISHRKAVYVFEETQKRLDYVVRKIGEQGASVSGYVEQVLREHLDHYKEDVETWRKL
ncbi:DUF3408 domain-containing protein [Porphyromonas crevioricanis]|uniref:DUF3408 domain-containing protein n=1 Tax=Porphyromonas crevioricanis TaxID=393921 RepID=A0AB34PL85_9PORP|nr:DUF3408 domain-containing protein [Porphyromonas crevioricanis]KGN95884.1 hypothetical protein HQ38_02660 [Porphyromonas crevioricanis]